MNKREFVMAVGGALVSGGTWAGAGASAASSQDGAVAQTGLQAWQQRVGERFAVFGTSMPTELVLDEVRTDADDGALQQFTLLFTRRGAPLTGGTRVLHPAGGDALALYLDDAGTDALGRALLRANFCLRA